MPRRACFAAAVAIATVLSGCGGRDEITPPAACTTTADALVVALAKAPGPVRLKGDIALSTCVHRSRGNADLQSVGALVIATADRLALSVDGSETAALQLGYLVGAVRRGAGRTNGIHAEIVRRLEQTTGLDGPVGTSRAAYARGLRAGERDG